jgi:hypothetical protein
MPTNFFNHYRPHVEALHPAQHSLAGASVVIMVIMITIVLGSMIHMMLTS